MIELKDLLGRFEHLLHQEEAKIDLLREVIGKYTSLNISKEKIKIKEGIVYLDIKPIYKNEILLKKEKILSELEKVLKNPPTIY